MSGENGILSRATQAKEKTEEAEREETEKLSGYEGIIDQYAGQTGEPLADKVEVGDYIKYGEKLTAKTYTTNTSETGCTETQTFETDTNMLWRVMGKKANGEVEIVAVSNILGDELTEGGTEEGGGDPAPASLLTVEVEPMLLSAVNENVKTGGLYLKGETGFLNAETVLKNLCSALYTSSYGEARSINVDDINALTGFNPETSDWDADEKDYYLNNRSKTYTSGKFWDKASNTFKIATRTDPVTVEHSFYYYTVAETMPLYDTLIQESTTYTGDYSETNYPLFYWLGSRSANAYDSVANFYVRTVDSGDVSYWYLVSANTDGNFDENENACGARPVVTLKSNIQVEETTATGGVTTWAIK